MTFIKLATFILMLMIIATVVVQIQLRLSTSDEVKKNNIRMFSWWGIFGISILVVSLVGQILFLAILVTSIWGTWEVTRLLKQQSRVSVWITSILILSIYSLLWFSNQTPRVWWYLLPLIGAVLSSLITPSATLAHAVNTATIAAGFMCILLLTKHATSLNYDARLILLLLLFLTSVNDIAQYCAGKLWGSRPLNVSISPNKTLEGALGGLIVTTLICALMLPTIVLAPWYWCAFIGLVTASAGIVGDLNISRLKRYAGTKNSGQLIPGHGGLLDRTDSLIMTAPVFGFILVTSMERLA